MRAATIATLATLCALGACKKTGEGEYEVQKPIVGFETDTVKVPEVEVKKDTHVIVTPDVDVNAPAARGDTARRP
jgi:hypothetical protein